MRTIDTRGQLCPAPLILTKKAISENLPGTQLEIITDNDIAFGNLKDYLCELDIRFREIYDGTIRTLQFTVPEPSLKEVEVTSFCSPQGSRESVVVLKSEFMGSGNDELGSLLIRAFLNTLLETDPFPSSIILYNGGAKLALRGTDTAQTLKKLEAKGATVIVCGTCADFYGIKQDLEVGVISNLYKITRILTQASSIIYP